MKPHTVTQMTEGYGELKQSPIGSNVLHDKVEW